MTTYSLDLSALTVIGTDAAGERHDLNADGVPCVNVDDLRSFIAQLEDVGAFDVATRDDLLAELGAQ